MNLEILSFFHKEFSCLKWEYLLFSAQDFPQEMMEWKATRHSVGLKAKFLKSVRWGHNSDTSLCILTLNPEHKRREMAQCTHTHSSHTYTLPFQSHTHKHRHTHPCKKNHNCATFFMFIKQLFSQMLIISMQIQKYALFTHKKLPKKSQCLVGHGEVAEGDRKVH